MPAVLTLRAATRQFITYPWPDKGQSPPTIEVECTVPSLKNEQRVMIALCTPAQLATMRADGTRFDLADGILYIVHERLSRFEQGGAELSGGRSDQFLSVGMHAKSATTKVWLDPADIGPGRHRLSGALILNDQAVESSSNDIEIEVYDRRFPPATTAAK